MTNWIADPIFWILALPALIASGILIQMVLSLFSCCGTFKFRGEAIHLKWWMIPTATVTCTTLWGFAVLYIVFG